MSKYGLIPMAALVWLVLLFHATTGSATINKTVVLLRELKLECRCPDVLKPIYVWRKDKKILNMASGESPFIDQRMSLGRGNAGLEAGVFDLVINPTESGDSATYDCIIYDRNDPNPRPQRCNQTFIATVVSRPKNLTALNTSIVVRERESQYLRCSTIGGFPAPKQIQWFDITEGNTIVQGKNQTSHSDGTLESSLLVTAPIESQLRGKYRRQYKCAVEQRDLIPILENDASSSQFYLHQTVNVEFHYTPKILAPPTLLDSADREFVENETVTFRCEASTAFPTDYAWFWSIDGRTIENSRGIGERNSMYRLTMTKDHHSRQLSCTVCVSSGCDAKNYTMRVKYRPRITIHPNKIVAEVGQQSIRFDCTADGNPPPVITWFNEVGHAVRKGGSDLQLNSIRKVDFGTYTCLATATTNGIDWVDRAEAYLLEKARPVILNPLREQHAITSSSIRLTCDVVSAMETTVWWYKDGVPISFNKENSRFSATKETRHDSTLHILTISNLERDDFGQYNCTISNEKGNTSMAVMLKHKDEVPFMAIIIAALAILFTLLILIIAVVACKRSKFGKGSAYRNTNSSKNKDNAAVQRRPKSVVMVQEQNGHPIATAVRNEAETNCKFIGDEYFPPFIEMDRGAYIRYEGNTNGEGNNNNPTIHDYNALMTLRGSRIGSLTPTGTYCNGCSMSCTGNTVACRKAANSGSDLLAIIPQQFHHPSVLRFNDEVEEIGPKEDGGSSYDSGFATSQTLPISAMQQTGSFGLVGPAQRVTNIDSLMTTLPPRTPSPAINDFIPKPSVTFATNQPVASTV